MANHEKHIDDLLKDGLGDYSEMPPFGAWEDMETRLANADGAERIDNVLYGALGDYTEAPPAFAWEDMETRLDNADGAVHIDNVLQSALGDYTETPPASAWVDMETMLDEKPSRRRPFAWFWYAAAVTGVLMVAYMFFGKDESHTARRGASTSEIIAPIPAPQTNNTVTNETVPPKAEEVATNNVVIPNAVQKEVKKEVKKETVAPAPQHKQVQQTPAQVAKNDIPEQKGNETPAQKIEDTQKDQPQVAQQVPVTTVTPETVAQQKDTVPQGDDIASAINKRGPGTVMNVIKSKYADSMEKVEQELAKLEQQKIANDTTGVTPPVIAATPDTNIELAKETAPASPDTITALAVDAINQTEQNMIVKQDAIPGSIVKIPSGTVVFEEPEDFRRVNTKTADPEIGSLAGFIGPRESALSYTDAWSGIEAGAPFKVRQPVSLDAFMKFGMETGVKANKFVFAPSLALNLSDRFSLVFQPTIKSGKVNFSGISNPRSYYAIESSYMDSLKSFTTGHNSAGFIFDSVRSTYFYQETYDSLVISHNLRSTTLMEAELPLMLSYKVSKEFSVYGGPLVTYSNMLQIDEKKDVYRQAIRRDTISYAVSVASEAPSGTPIREVFTYGGKNISEYVPAPYANATVNKLRLGYMLGISYSHKRFSADLSVQQNLSRLNYIPNAAVKNIYMQPYTRFMIGYQLNNRKK